MSNGPVCPDHAVEAVARWEPAGVHDYGPHCGAPGAVWELGGCRVPFVAPGLGCARCGACCDEIRLPFESVDDVRAKAVEISDQRSLDDLTFIADHWRLDE
jgi:hypothetical protein